MADQNMKSGWGEFTLTTIAAIGITLVGGLANNMSNLNTCETTTYGDKKPAFGYAGTVAIGTGIGTFVNILSQKFNLQLSEIGKLILLLIIGFAIMIIGSIAMAYSEKMDSPSDLDDLENDVKHLKELAGVVLGFGLGLIIPALIKIILLYTNSKVSGQSGDYNTQVALALGTSVFSLFATIIGSWAWNKYDQCAKDNEGEEIGGSGAAGLNGFATVLSALITVVCCVFAGFRLAGRHDMADAMYNFRKTAGGALNRKMSVMTRQ